MFIRSSEPAGPVVQMRLTFRAPRAMVWRTFTDAELLKKWHFADPGWETYDAKVELAPLGTYELHIRPKDRSWDSCIHGNFVEVRDQERLAYTFTGAAESADYYTLVTVRFEDTEDGGSALELTHGVFADEEARLMHEQGWFGCFSQLAALLDEELTTG